MMSTVCNTATHQNATVDRFMASGRDRIRRTLCSLSMPTHLRADPANLRFQQRAAEVGWCRWFVHATDVSKTPEGIPTTRRGDPYNARGTPLVFVRRTNNAPIHRERKRRGVSREFPEGCEACNDWWSVKG